MIDTHPSLPTFQTIDRWFESVILCESRAAGDPGRLCLELRSALLAEMAARDALRAQHSRQGADHEQL
jgi:hypothetical protein